MNAAVETNRARQALRAQVGTPELHPLHPRGQGRRARRAERSRQDHPAPARRRAARTDIGHDHAFSAGVPATARRSSQRVGFVAQDTPTYAGPVGCQAPAHGRLSQRELGPGAGQEPDRTARPRPTPEGGFAFRRPTGPARPDPSDRQAARAPAPRRARGELGPACAARVPPEPDGGRRRPRCQRRALLTPRRRSRAGL